MYKGRDRTSANFYAVKKILIQTAEIRRSLQIEIRSFDLFNHPNVLQLIDFEEKATSNNNGIAYLLFPLVPKGSLRHILNQQLLDDPKRLKTNIRRVLEDFKSICSAFNHMHTLSPTRYIHQDIKPDVSLKSLSHGNQLKLFTFCYITYFYFIKLTLLY